MNVNTDLDHNKQFFRLLHMLCQWHLSQAKNWQFLDGDRQWHKEVSEGTEGCSWELQVMKHVGNYYPGKKHWKQGTSAIAICTSIEISRCPWLMANILHKQIETTMANLSKWTWSLPPLRKKHNMFFLSVDAASQRQATIFFGAKVINRRGQEFQVSSPMMNQQIVKSMKPLRKTSNIWFRLCRSISAQSFGSQDLGPCEFPRRFWAQVWQR